MTEAAEAVDGTLAAADRAFATGSPSVPFVAAGHEVWTRTVAGGRVITRGASTTIRGNDIGRSAAEAG